jgi:hypothetical protein
MWITHRICDCIVAFDLDTVKLLMTLFVSLIAH